MDRTRRVWIGLAASLTAILNVLLGVGRDAAQQWIRPDSAVVPQP